MKQVSLNNWLLLFIVVLLMMISASLLYIALQYSSNRVAAVTVVVVTPTLNPGVTIANTPSIPAPTLARPSPSSTSTRLPSATISSGLPLPKAMTSTPLPAKLITLTLTNQMATELASQQSRSGNVTIQNQTVAFTKDNVLFRGDVTVHAPFAPGVIVFSGAMRVVGKLQCDNDEIRFIANSVTINGADNQDKEVKGSVERAINDTLSSYVGARRVKSCVLSDGKLTITASEPQP